MDTLTHWQTDRPKPVS